MSWTNIDVRTSSDLNVPDDINNLMENIRVLGGNTSYAPSTDIQSLYSDVETLKSQIIPVPKKLAVQIVTGADTSTWRGIIAADELYIDNVKLEGVSCDLYLRANAFTNDISTGTSVQINTPNTAGFEIGNTITIQSGTGIEEIEIADISTDTYIVAEEITLDHDTTKRYIGHIGAGMLDALPATTSTIFPLYIHVCSNDDGSSYCAIASESYASPTLPTGYTKKRNVSYVAAVINSSVLSFNKALQIDDIYNVLASSCVDSIYGHAFVDSSYAINTSYVYDLTSTSWVSMPLDITTKADIVINVSPSVVSGNANAYNWIIGCGDIDGTSIVMINHKESAATPSGYYPPALLVNEEFITTNGQVSLMHTRAGTYTVNVKAYLKGFKLEI